jgi:hypothetical protein
MCDGRHRQPFSSWRKLGLEYVGTHERVHHSKLKWRRVMRINHCVRALKINRMGASNRATTTLLAGLFLFSTAAIPARAQTTVTVPGNASGHFGNPADLVVPFVPAITVSGPSSITVKYVSA